MENMIKRFLSLMLALVLTLSCAPMVAFAEGEVDYVAYNVETAQQYTDVSDAAKAAAEGQTVRLLKDAKDSIVTILEGTTLDLSGFSLEAEYVANFGQLEDNSASNTGCLKVEKGRFMIRGDNTQLPVLTENGYQFVEFIGFKEAWLAEGTKYAFQPTFEPYAHTLLSNGTDNTDLTINVRVSWEQGDGTRYQDFVYSNDHVAAYVASYDAATGKYGKMFTLTIRDAANFSGLTIGSVVASVSGVEKASDGIEIKDSNVTVDENNMVTEDVTVSAGQASAVVPQGTLLEKDTTKLSLTVDEIDESQSNITLGENETQKSVDVHIAGVSADNTVPMAITLKEFAAPGLNEGNLKLYHVEDGVTNEMTRVASVAEFTAHNQFCYDAVTGDVVLYMATFSEVAAVSNDTKAWEGNFDYSWYDADETELTIANADQLAGFGAIVGGMAKDAEGAAIAQDSFDDKTVKLVNDINLGDKESENNPDLIFYPIGYNSDDGKYEKTGVAVTTGFYTFNGTFDGNGHTISNFYQNTWEMKGDNNYYDAKLQYYRDGMGLFGKVYGGTVKNLTVNNFSSDGEFTTTGVIAAYADDATFQNIAITNCNPRVYNIGNGGIVGCVGWYAKEADLKTTFSNITVDNSNKISALWGSYDVACGGIVGQYYPTSGQSGSPKNAGIRFENCHVSAQMDVYNDVCANYQYYAYRYTGMMIGSIRENETIDGHVYPKMDGITASNCTVNFGDWNDYYYCELVANSLASYTHDHQMSRLDQVQSVDVENKKVTDLDGNTTEIPTSGRYNYVVVTRKDENGQWIHGDGADYATCYHFVDGKVHSHNDYNGDGTDDYETVNGESVLVEDKQLVYREFNQLFTGYGWGVTSKGLTDFDGVETMGIDIEEGDQEESIEKFVKVEDAVVATDVPVTIGKLFAENTAVIESTGIEVNDAAVQVAVTDMDSADGTVTAVYTASATDKWEDGTLTITGTGKVRITIQDYYYCVPVTLELTVLDEMPKTDRFEAVFPNTGVNEVGVVQTAFLYRVGNQNAVNISSLFKLAEGVEAEDVGTVSVEVVDASGNPLNVYTDGTGNWDSGKIQFAEDFTGPVKVTISDDNYSTPVTLNLEVVTAKNITSAEGATANNVVLLNDVVCTNGFTVSGNHTFYGNGFTVTLPTTVQSSYSAGYVGYITMSGGNLDNVIVKGPVYPEMNIFREQAKDSADATKANYFFNSVLINSGNNTISNSYVSGSRTAICIRGGNNVLIENTTVSGGAAANIHLASANAVTLRNLTTQQVDETDSYGQGKTVHGMGVYVEAGSAELKIEKALTQHNWINEDQWDAMVPLQYQSSFPDFFGSNAKYTVYQHNRNGVTHVNLGFIFACNWDASTLDTAKQSNNDEYKATAGITMSGYTGGVYTTANQGELTDDMYNADEYISSGFSPVAPVLNFDNSLNHDDDDETDAGDTYCVYDDATGILKVGVTEDSTTINISGVRITKDGATLVHTAYLNGTEIAGDTVTLSLDNGTSQTLTFKATSNEMGYDEEGNPVSGSIDYSWSIKVNLAKQGYANPEWTMGSYTLNAKDFGCVWVEYNTDFGEAVPMFKGISVKYYDAEGEHTVNFAEVEGEGTLTADGITANMISFTHPTGYKLEIKYSSEWKGGAPNYHTVKYNNAWYIYPSNLDNSSYAVNNKQEFDVRFTYTFTDPNGKCTETITVRWHDDSTYSEITEVQWKTFDDTNGKTPGCVTPDTLVTLADGTQKRIDEVSYEDQLLVWDFVNGEYTAMPSIVVRNHGYDDYEVLTLNFSDGSKVNVIEEHGFFDVALNEFVLIDESNVTDYVGHEFVQVDGDGYTTITLESYSVAEEYTAAYSILTAVHYNCILGDMLTLTPNVIGGNYFMPFEVGEDMKFDAEVMQADIEKYGLFTYEEFAHLVTEEQFYALNAPQVKVAVGKGIITMEDLYQIIETLIPKEE